MLFIYLFLCNTNDDMMFIANVFLNICYLDSYLFDVITKKLNVPIVLIFFHKFKTSKNNHAISIDYKTLSTFPEIFNRSTLYREIR